MKTASSNQSFGLSLVSGAVASARVQISQFAASGQRQVALVPPPLGRKSFPADRDYLVSIGSATYQVSITTSNGTRYFRLIQL